LEWLQKRPEVLSRGYKIEVPETLKTWVREETKLGNPALSAKVEATGDPDLKLALRWSSQVNEDIEAMVHGVSPFPYVRECLHKLAPHADMLCVSATPGKALEAEWKEHGIEPFVRAICGQESGSKKETLANATKYPAHHTLMIGDAPGDYDAARANHCLFYPINPGDEERSWKRLLEEGIDTFLAGQFAGSYQQMLLDEFDRCLPAQPPWPVM
ncbi:MAG: HAD hydrolase-like protein, partial [Planctomycetota bacterium]|nr:HAD hydrolase-like protein [Planctomycetota bacterium]